MTQWGMEAIRVATAEDVKSAIACIENGQELDDRIKTWVIAAVQTIFDVQQKAIAEGRDFRDPRVN